MVLRDQDREEASWDVVFERLGPQLGIASAPAAAQRPAARSNDQPHDQTSPDVTTQLYNLSMELRDRLRFSQQRINQLKAESATTAAQQQQERQAAATRLATLESELTRLQGVEAAHLQLQVSYQQLSQQLMSISTRVEEYEQHHKEMEISREKLQTEAHAMQEAADAAQLRLAQAEKQLADTVGQLLSTKTRLANLAQVDALYTAARDELERLDKENQELKEMVDQNVLDLTKSRLLEYDIEDASKAAGRSRPASTSKLRRRPADEKAPNNSHDRPWADSLRGSSSPGRAWIPPSRHAASDVLPSYTLDKETEDHLSHALLGLDPLSEMAFLGPPSSSYPPDPDNYILHRVGGGFLPKKDPANPVQPLPRASGWVPVEVVRLAQAFRHTYGLSLDWPFWEPLLLMIDEVYSRRQSSMVNTVKAQQKEKLQVVKRQLGNAVTYPAVVATSKIGSLQKQMQALRKSLGAAERSHDRGIARGMAQKGYHMGHQLDMAVEENLALRKSLEQLSNMFSHQQQLSGSPRRSQSGTMEQEPRT